ncbi:hypothetical protein BC829DRAFT_291442 [Chytridium lagenaria]|nr:hypothetical protein BC829DRAFT_291442 [Chytridium lagenaria]
MTQLLKSSMHRRIVDQGVAVGGGFSEGCGHESRLSGMNIGGDGGFGVGGTPVQPRVWVPKAISPPTWKGKEEEADFIKGLEMFLPEGLRRKRSGWVEEVVEEEDEEVEGEEVEEEEDVEGEDNTDEEDEEDNEDIVTKVKIQSHDEDEATEANRVERRVESILTQIHDLETFQIPVQSPHLRRYAALFGKLSKCLDDLSVAKDRVDLKTKAAESVLDDAKEDETEAEESEDGMVGKTEENRRWGSVDFKEMRNPYILRQRMEEMEESKKELPLAAGKYRIFEPSLTDDDNDFLDVPPGAIPSPTRPIDIRLKKNVQPIKKEEEDVWDGGEEDASWVEQARVDEVAIDESLAGQQAERWVGKGGEESVDVEEEEEEDAVDSVKGMWMNMLGDFFITSKTLSTVEPLESLPSMSKNHTFCCSCLTGAAS